MIIAIAFSPFDWQAAHDLLEWILELDGRKARNHLCLLVASKGMATYQIESVQAAAYRAYANVITIAPHVANEIGWPVSCNNLFRAAAEAVRIKFKQPFWWNEPDCIPTKRRFLETIEREYKKRGKPFMGTVCDAPFVHLSGCAVYPPDIQIYNPDCVTEGLKDAWDCVAQEKTVPHAHNSKIMQHVWGNQTNNIAPTFPNQRSLRLLKRRAVIFHRNKDGTLIKRLRERRRNRLRSLIQSFRDPKIGNGFQQFSERDQSKMKRAIHGVTLVAVDGSSDCRRTMRAMINAGNQVALDACILFGRHRPELLPDWIKFRAIPPMDLNGYNKFCLTDLHNHINSTHCLTIQSDSGINNAEAWDYGWLQYDYIGAPWPPGWAWDTDCQTWERVGNSGFCLRSVRFLKATRDLPTDHVVWHGKRVDRCVDDVAACVNHRQKLIDAGMKFAPVSVASKFAFEQPTPESPRLNGHFGFHIHTPPK